MTAAPFVSVVTPFYNSADFLDRCIESVRAQRYPAFEYLLVDNQSTDESPRIAERHAQADGRIRVIRTERFVGQVENYNGALARVGAEARYVKLVQADDEIFPECLERMVAVGEAHPTAGIVSAYRIRGSDVAGGGVPWPAEFLPGREAARLYLKDGRHVYGSPTTVLYRADLVRGRQPFYDPAVLHDDTDLCLDVLDRVDFGFAHQVLSFTRVGNASTLESRRDYHWQLVSRLVAVERFGPRYLTADELAAARDDLWGEYLPLIARCRLEGRGADFWDFHRRALAEAGLSLPGWDRLARYLPRVARQVVGARLFPWRRA